MGIDAMLRATTQHKSQDAQGEGEASVDIPVEGGGGEGGGVQHDRGGGLLLGGGGGRKLSSPVEVTSVSYLSVPDTNSSRRPSTADLFIEKLQVEKVEGGGLSIQGVALASHCHVTLCVFGVFFMLAGVILSYVSYSVAVGKKNDEGEGEGKAQEPERHSSVSQMRMIGPSFLVLGLLMLGLGISLLVLAKKISRDEKVKQLVISEQQLCQLEDSFSYAKTASPLRTHAPAPHQQYPILAVRRNSWWMDPSLMDHSAAQVDARDTGVQCPSPIGEDRETPTSSMSPTPLDLLPDLSIPQAGIACFPASPHPEPAGDLVNLLPSNTEDNAHKASVKPPLSLPLLPNPSTDTPSPSPTPQDQPYPRLASAAHCTAGVQEVRGNRSATSHGRRSPALVPFSASQIPSIQVTAPPPAPPLLPRLSRHCSAHIDSRPTTAADSRMPPQP